MENTPIVDFGILEGSESERRNLLSISSEILTLNEEIKASILKEVDSPNPC